MELASSPQPLVLSPSRAKRLANVRDGIDLLKVWLGDAVRAGLSSAMMRDPATYEAMAKRLVDAQAPGAARMVLKLGQSLRQTQGSDTDGLTGLGLLHLLVRAVDQLESLPIPMAEELLSLLGFSTKKEEVLQSAPFDDTWHVAAQHTFEDGNLTVKRSWLYGAGSKTWAMHLSYKVFTQPFDPDLRVGSAFHAKSGFFPGVSQKRVAVVDMEEALFVPPPSISASELRALWAETLGVFPWTEVVGLALACASMAMQDGVLIAVDSRDESVPLEISGDRLWILVAAAGGSPCQIYGEFDGQRFRPSAVHAQGGFDPL